MKRIFFVLSITCLSFFIYAEKFEFKYVKGDQFKVLSSVDEAVFINNDLAYQTEIFNRIAFSIVETGKDWGKIDGIFETSERLKDDPTSYIFQRSYDSVFTRDKLGFCTIEDKYYMPVVRNVPLFPDRDIKIGEIWTAPGEERHDFRDGYGIPDPYKIPFTAQYTYAGKESLNGKEYGVILVAYTIMYHPGKPKTYKTTYPTRIMGTSDQRILWDFELGMPISYTERFRIILNLANGNYYEFSGTAESKIVKSELMDRTKIADAIQKQIDTLKLNDIAVTQTEEGVMLSIEDIRFESDSAKLLPGESEKLDKIAQILLKYKDRDIVIAGHTALAGTEQERNELSLMRAKVVADYFLQKGIRTADEMTVRGYGSSKPVADNATEDGKKKNRRVEIIILEN